MKRGSEPCTGFRQLLVVLIVAVSNLFAQPARTAWEPGYINFSIGHGILNTDALTLRLQKTDERPVKDIKTKGSYYGKFDYAITDLISIGASLAYSQLDFSIWTPRGSRYALGKSEFRSWRVTVLTAMVRVNFHYYIGNKYSAYGGIGLGHKHLEDYYPESEMNFFPYLNFTDSAVEATFGIRYIGSRVLGWYAEVGAARSVLQAGLTFTIKR